MIFISVLLFLSCASHSFLAFAEDPRGDSTTTNRPITELLLCRKCGSDVADSSYLFDKHSPGAKKVVKNNLFGKNNVTVQTLVNPFGISFDVVTIEKARCQNMGMPQGGDSWFPGYAWRICLCPRCGHHLGWTFQSVSDKSSEQPNETEGHIAQFHGLVLSSILGENYTELGAQKQSDDRIRYGLIDNDAQNLQDVNENLV